MNKLFFNKYLFLIIVILLFSSECIAQLNQELTSQKIAKLKRDRLHKIDSVKKIIIVSIDSVKIHQLFLLVDLFEHLNNDSIDQYIKVAELTAKDSPVLQRVYSNYAIRYCSSYPIYPSEENNKDILRKLKLAYQIYYLNEKIDKHIASKALNCVWMMYAVIGDYNKAIFFENKRFNLLVKKKFSDSLLHYENLGYIHSKEENFIEAANDYNKALKIAQNHPDNLLNELTAVLNVCSAKSNCEQYEKVIELLHNYKKKMNEFIERKFVIDDYFYYDIILRYQDILGSSLGAINKLQKADSVFNYTLKFAESNRLSSYHLSDIKLNYADVLRKQKRFTDAISVLEQVLSFSIDDLNQKAYIFRTLSELFEENGNLPKSILYIKKYSSTKDSLIILQGKENNFKQAAIIGAEFELKRQIEIEKVESERRIKLSEERDRRNRLIIGSVIAGLIVVLIISFYIYKLLITARKQKLIIEVQKLEVDKKNHIIEEKQKEIFDSINYAKRIQYTLLAHEQFLKDNLSQNFVFFNPKDIVSGDFYWATKMGPKFYLAVCDSTGHGIPGAFMSLLNIGFLSEAINEKGIEKPNEVFDYVRMKLTNTISKEGQKDGFDGILVCFDQKSNTITYAAANNAPIIIAGGQIIEALADRMPVGVGERKENFTLHTLEVKPSDVLYLYTDGYADQFGGPRGKKFKYKQLNELLLAVHTKPIGEQSVELKNAFETWKGDLEQVDDVCVIGIKI